MNQRSLTARILACFDQAASRGIPASRIITGLVNKFEIRQPRVTELLTVHKRITTCTVGDVEAYVATQRAVYVHPSSNKFVMEQLVQAAVDYGMTQQHLDAETVASAAAATASSGFRASDDVLPFLLEMLCDEGDEGEEDAHDIAA